MSNKEATMQYNSLGKSGVKISELSFGSWITFGKQLGVKDARKMMHYAFEQGVNFFDNAEAYAHGDAEIIMGEILKDFRREALLISTKLFWGGNGPNDTGLSRKHLIEGTKNSLKRLQVDYVDLLFCHRPDPTTPIEETVLAMDYLVRSGYAFYWGTSEWNADQLTQAYKIATDLNCIPPTMEQPEYNMFHRMRVEKELAPLYEKQGLGTTIWSPLASGLLSGKYNKGIPADSRLAREAWLCKPDLDKRITCVKKLVPIAEQIGCTMPQLALAWCLKNPFVSTVIIGASCFEQLQENLDASQVKAKIDNKVMTDINKILEEYH
jgi:voltage-dependent potassium channel beta subunit